MKKKDYSNAIERYNECLTLLDFENPAVSLSTDKIEKYVLPSLTNIAQCCIELKQYHKAMNQCKKVLELRPHHKKALNLQGIACVQVGDFKGAMKNVPRN